MSLLTRYGVCSYNGFDFNEKTETTSISIRPQYDASGRTVVYNVFALGLKTFIAGDDINATLLAMRRLLMKPGGALRYTGRGFGLFDINLGGQKDVIWGPKPQEFSFKPLGRDNACEVTWRVEVAMPDCSEARYEFWPLEFNFSVTYDLDKGYTTRTVTGHLRVPMTRRNQEDRTLPDSVDSYRERLMSLVMPGFRRSFGPFVISQDKTKLDFTVIDTEMRGPPPPPQVVNLTASAEVASGEKGLAQWAGSISADYELLKYADPLIAAKHFIGVLVKDRINATAANVNRNPQKAQASQAILPVRFVMKEPEIYGENKAGFQFVYTFIQPLKHILTASALWRPVPGTDNRAWAASMMAGPFNPRGYAQLEFRVGDDRIVDLCDNSPVIVDLSAGGTKTRASIANNVVAPAPAAAQIAELVYQNFPTPTPQASWVAYQNELWVEFDDGVTALRPLTGNSTIDAVLRAQPGGGADPSTIFDPFLGTLFGGGLGPGGGQVPYRIPLGIPTGPLGALFPSTKWQTQQRAPRACFVYMFGAAARAGFPIPIPELASINGQRVVRACRLDRDEGFGQGIKWAANGPVYLASWNIRYALPDQPGFLPIPPNPLLGPS